jgi:HSP20 family protein
MSLSRPNEFPADIFAEFDRLQQLLSGAYRGVAHAPDIRASRGAFPAINIGTTEDAIELIALAPGIDPSKVEISIDHGLLTISGERTVESGGASDGRATTYARERFSGPFRRVVTLPEDSDPDRVEARYTDGCLRVTIKKRESSKPRSIRIQ